MAEKTIEVGVKAKKEDISKEEATEQIIATAVEIVIITAFAMIGAKCYKKNRGVGSIIGTAAAKTLIFCRKKSVPLLL